MSLDRLLARIVKDADSAGKAEVEEARRQAARIREEGWDRAARAGRAVREEIMGRAEAERVSIMGERLARSRATYLTRQEELYEQVFADALREAGSLPEEQLPRLAQEDHRRGRLPAGRRRSWPRPTTAACWSRGCWTRSTGTLRGRGSAMRPEPGPGKGALRAGRGTQGGPGREQPLAGDGPAAGEGRKRGGAAGYHLRGVAASRASSPGAAEEGRSGQGRPDPRGLAEGPGEPGKLPGFLTVDLKRIKPFHDAVRYGYAVGRIRVLEAQLISGQRLRRLIEADYEEALRILDEVPIGDYLMDAATAERWTRASPPSSRTSIPPSASRCPAIPCCSPSSGAVTISTTSRRCSRRGRRVPWLKACCPGWAPSTR